MKNYRVRLSGYAKFMIVLSYFYLVVFAFSIQKYAEYQVKYGRLIDMMWRVSKRNYLEGIGGDFDRNYSYLELLEWIDFVLFIMI